MAQFTINNVKKCFVFTNGKFQADKKKTVTLIQTSKHTHTHIHTHTHKRKPKKQTIVQKTGDNQTKKKRTHN